MIDITEHSNIVFMDQFRNTSVHPALAQVEAYWEGLRAGRMMPTRAEVDPRGISGALEHAFILERVARGIARFRLAGTHFSDIMGMEVRGMPLTAIMTADGRPPAIDALEAVFETPAVLRLSLVAEGGIGRPPLSGEMLILPLRSDLGDVTRALGCFVATGSIGRTPRRFSVTEQHRRSLVGFGSLPAAEPASRPAPQPGPRPHPDITNDVPGFSETPAPFSRSSRRSHLRLVKND